MGGGRGTRPPTENQRERSRLGTARARQWVNLPLVALDLVVSQLRVRRRVSRVSLVLHFCVWTLGLGQSSACLKMDVEAWLGEYFKDSDGSEVVLPDDVKVVLAKAFKDGVLDAKQDVLDD